MITQLLMDTFATVIAQLLTLIPALPAAFSTALGYVSGFGTYMAGWLAPLGVIVPWNIVSTCMTIYLGYLAFWLAMAAGRLILWALGR